MSILNSSELKKLSGLISSASKILITTHVNSDGDAIGSSLALALAFKKLGKEVMVMTPNDFPGFLRWLPGQELISVYYHEAQKIREWTEKSDLIFAVDYNDPKRLKRAETIITESSVFKVMIDHHPFPVDFTDLMISVTKLSSAAETVFYVLKELGFEHLLDKDIATCLFTGIMTDTGCFSYSSSYPEIFTTVAELISLGIDKDSIYSSVYDNFSESRMRLMGFCLNEKMIVFPEFRTAYISLTRDEIKRFRHSPGDTEGFVNLPFSIKGIVFTALFIEKDEHVKISFRSRGIFPVNEFSSKYFNGGGHLNAAGGEWKETLQNTVKKFVDLLPLYKNKLL